jgi:UDP-N-acetylglucosamine transferase subunit ALG13
MAGGEFKGGQVFVTVGTTLFDALVKEASSPQCRRVLVDLGYTSLIIQRGKGSFIPAEVNAAAPVSFDCTF